MSAANAPNLHILKIHCVQWCLQLEQSGQLKVDKHSFHRNCINCKRKSKGICWWQYLSACYGDVWGEANGTSQIRQTVTVSLISQASFFLMFCALARIPETLKPPEAKVEEGRRVKNWTECFSRNVPSLSVTHMEKLYWKHNDYRREHGSECCNSILAPVIWQCTRRFKPKPQCPSVINELEVHFPVHGTE